MTLDRVVDFVEHDHGIVAIGTANTLDDLPGQRANVIAAMAADLRLIVHAAQRDALELAPQGTRD